MDPSRAANCARQSATSFTVPNTCFNTAIVHTVAICTGSAHASNIIVDPKQFEWLSGEDQVGRFENSEARHFATCFCKQCGSSLPWLAQSGAAVIIPAGTLDDDPEIKPVQNIYWKYRAPWREAVEALPQHDELQPRKMRT